jgi:hypothetical protein
MSHAGAPAADDGFHEARLRATDDNVRPVTHTPALAQQPAAFMLSYERVPPPRGAR